MQGKKLVLLESSLMRQQTYCRFAAMVVRTERDDPALYSYTRAVLVGSSKQTEEGKEST